jgi:hypothetical protein
MATIKVSENIEVWQLAREVSNGIFDSSNIGSFSKDYGLRDQLKVHRAL